MYSSIIGDIVGSTFEVENNRSIYFEFFRKDARFTDDTVCTAGVADILLKNKTKIIDYINKKNNDNLQTWNEKDFYGQDAFLNNKDLSNSLRLWCLQFLNRGFGSIFQQWILNGVNMPYNSYGNGSLMRISPVALFCHRNKINKINAIDIALDITNITHNHALSQRSVATYIDILMTLMNKSFKFIQNKDEDMNISFEKNSENNHVLNCFFHYKLLQYGLLTQEEGNSDNKFLLISKDMMLQYPDYFDYSELNQQDIYVQRLPNSQELKVSLDFNLKSDISLKVVLASIIEASSFEEGLRIIVSCGGDTDTYCAIGGPILEVIDGIPDDMIDNMKKYFKRHDLEILSIMERLYQ